MRLETTGKFNNKKLSIVMDVLLALMLGGACFYVFITMFGLRWPAGGIFSGSITRGMAGIWDKIADKLGNLDYVILPKYKASMSASGAPKCGTALTMILAAFSVISYFIIKSRTRLLMLIFAVPLGLMMLTLGVTPSAYAGGLFAAAVIIVLAVMRIEDDIDPKYLVVPLAIVIAACAVLGVVDKTVSLREPRELATYAESVKKSIDNMRYGTDPLPAGEIGTVSGKDIRTSRGDIDSVKEVLGTTEDPWQSDYGSLFDSDNTADTEEDGSSSKKSAGSKTALTVRMRMPESYYLRGFIGASYSKNKWSTLSNDTFYGMRDTVFWLNRRNFDGLSEMSRAAELGDSDGSEFYSDDFGSEDTNDSGSGITFDDESDEEDDEDTEDSDDDSEDEDTDDSEDPFADSDDSDGGSSTDDSDDDPFSTVGFIDQVYAEGEDDITSNRINIKVKDASRRYAYIPYELELKPASGNKARKSEMILPKGTKNYGGSHLGTEGIAGKSSYSYRSSANITGEWTDAVGKLYTAPQTEDIQSYFISESHYNVMQYENYLDIPSKLKLLFNAELGSPGDISEDHKDYKEAIDLISNYLADSYIYSESFSKPKGKEDIVEKFVETRSGCDIHFATLAALLFRYYGIPARYVEGYLITPKMVETKAENEEIDVTHMSNHAWTEIYIDGFGWVPFEATPEYRGVMNEADMTVGLQNVDYETTPPQPDDTENDEYNEEDDEEEGKIGRKLLKIFLTLLILLIIALLLYIIYKVGRKVMEERRWKKAFADKDPKKGIKALYQYASNHKWRLSDAAEGLGLAASYSTVEMQESDRKTMLLEFNKAKEQAKKDKAAAKEKARKEKAEAKAEAKQERAAAKARKDAEKAAVKQEKAAAKAADKQVKAADSVTEVDQNDEKNS